MHACMEGRLTRATPCAASHAGARTRAADENSADLQRIRRRWWRRRPAAALSSDACWRDTYGTLHNNVVENVAEEQERSTFRSSIVVAFAIARSANLFIFNLLSPQTHYNNLINEQ
jgi:hypothetical protein